MKEYMKPEIEEILFVTESVTAGVGDEVSTEVDDPRNPQ